MAWRPEHAEKKLQKYTSIEKAIYSNVPTLARIRREEGQEATRKMIMSWMFRLMNFVNLKRGLTDEQLRLTADMIMEDYYALRVSDLNLIFKRGMRGDYGKLYDRLDGQVILGWFKQYFDERCEIAEGYSQAKNLQTKKINKETADLLGPVVEIVKKKIPELPEKKLTEQQMREKTREVYANYLATKDREGDDPPTGSDL